MNGQQVPSFTLRAFPNLRRPSWFSIMVRLYLLEQGSVRLQVPFHLPLRPLCADYFLSVDFITSHKLKRLTKENGFYISLDFKTIFKTAQWTVDQKCDVALDSLLSVLRVLGFSHTKELQQRQKRNTYVRCLILSLLSETRNIIY